jgi:hypothetical protein
MIQFTVIVHWTCGRKYSIGQFQRQCNIVHSNRLAMAAPSFLVLNLIDFKGIHPG